MNGRKAARILVVEDEESIALPFAEALRRAGFEPLLTGTAAGALELADSASPDLVMLDLALPDGDGRDVCRDLRRRSQIPIVMVKPFSAAEVISRIRAVLRRAGPVEPAPRGPLRAGRLVVDQAARRATMGDQVLDLSRKEFDLLAELMRHRGEVVTREDLMSRVWDMNWFGSTKTLDVHIGWLRRKLGDVAADPEYIETVRGVGFRFVASEVEEP